MPAEWNIFQRKFFLGLSPYSSSAISFIVSSPRGVSSAAATDGSDLQDRERSYIDVNHVVQLDTQDINKLFAPEHCSVIVTIASKWSGRAE